MDIEPTPIDTVPIATKGTIDLAPLSLEEGKQYQITTTVDATGAAVTSVEEIIPPAQPPQSDVVVFRHRSSGNAYLGQLISGAWTVSFSVYRSWDDVLDAFPVEQWTMVEVVV